MAFVSQDGKQARRRKSRRRITLTVSFDLPEEAKADEAIGYVEAAVGFYAKSLHPPGAYGDDDDGDPWFGLDSDSIIVKPARVRK